MSHAGLQKSYVNKCLIVEGHLNPELFNHKLQARLFNHKLFKPMIQKFKVEKSGVEKFTVKKYGVERSRVEAWG